MSEKRCAYLKQKRKEKRLTVDKLAERIGVSPSTIKNIEAGNNEVKAWVLYELSKLYGVSMNDLWTGGRFPLAEECHNYGERKTSTAKSVSVKIEYTAYTSIPRRLHTEGLSILSLIQKMSLKCSTFATGVISCCSGVVFTQCRTS